MEDDDFDPPPLYSTIYVRWDHPENTTGLSHYIVAWIPVNDDEGRIEELEKTSDPILYDPRNISVATYIYNITQGECYDVRVVSVDDRESKTYSNFIQVRTCKIQIFIQKF